jgi:hypothetical protein
MVYTQLEVGYVNPVRLDSVYVVVHQIRGGRGGEVFSPNRYSRSWSGVKVVGKVFLVYIESILI